MERGSPLPVDRSLQRAAGGDVCNGKSARRRGAGSGRMVRDTGRVHLNAGTARATATAPAWKYSSEGTCTITAAGTASQQPRHHYRGERAAGRSGRLRVPSRTVQVLAAHHGGHGVRAGRRVVARAGSGEGGDEEAVGAAVGVQDGGLSLSRRVGVRTQLAAGRRDQLARKFAEHLLRERRGGVCGARVGGSGRSADRATRQPLRAPATASCGPMKR